MSVMVGEIKLWSGENIPAGWLACNGQSLSVASYLPLYTVLGNLYGGDSTTFNLPDLRDRTVRGLNITTQLLGSTTGSDYVTITNNNLPQHTHTATFTSSTSTSTTVSVAIPANDTTDNPVNTPSTTTVMAKGTTGSDPASVYTTEAASTTLKPFDTTVNLPTVQGSVQIDSSSYSPQVPVNLAVAVPLKFSTMPPTMTMRYIIAVNGIYPTRP